MTTTEPVKIRGNGGVDVLVIPSAPFTDSRLSAADVGVYMRCQWLSRICGQYGDLDWLITELGMPEAETRDSVRRLVEFGHLELASAAEVAWRASHDMRDGVRAAIETTVDGLTPAERVTVARFADLVDRRHAQVDAAYEAERKRWLTGSWRRPPPAGAAEAAASGQGASRFPFRPGPGPPPQGCPNSGGTPSPSSTQH